MVKRWTGLGRLLGAVWLAACGSPPAPAETPPPVASIESSAPARASSSVLVGTCVMPETMPACDWPEVDDEALAARIEALKTKVKDSAWKDHASLIELTRLQLLASGGASEGVAPTADGPQLNAKRALAVAATPSARLVAALAFLHTHLPRTESAVARQMLFALVEGMLDVGSAPVTPAVEQARALVGYHQLISAGETPGGGAATPLGGFATQVHADWEAGHRSRARLATYPPLSRAIREARVPEPWVSPFALAGGDLAPVPAPVTPCDAAARRTPEGEVFCGAAQALETSPSVATAKGVLDAYRGLKPACTAKEPVCGPHVPEAMVATGAAFADAGQLAKAIAVHRITLQQFQSSVPDVLLRLSDAYFRIGVLGLGASWGVRYARAQGWRTPEVLRRVLVIELALGQPAHRIDWLGRALRVRAIPASERRAWATLAVQSIPPPERARWRAKLPAAVRPTPVVDPPASAPPCDATLLCGYVAVLNDPSWSARDESSAALEPRRERARASKRRKKGEMSPRPGRVTGNPPVVGVRG